VRSQTTSRREHSPAFAPAGGTRARFACPRCHRIVDELHRVAMANVLSYLEWDVCAACVRSLRALASDLELVEVLE
jgi:hypothetical protein